MIKGISTEIAPLFTLKEYENLDDGKKIINEFLIDLK